MIDTLRSRDRGPAADSGLGRRETILALAGIAVLAAALIPLFSGYVRDSQAVRARNEGKAIADAVTAAYKDLGRWPNRLDNTSSYGGLYTGAVPPTDAFLRIAAGWARAGDAWSRLDTHLLRNGHGYPDAGENRWKGPYAARLPTDPWGRPYVINSLYFTLPSDPPIPVWVLSAGPNGILETNIDSNVTSPGGDDIGVRIR
ncbi:MAG: type II secretion system protein GspG [Deltaproteobacteria bacterium]|nr:type II secretion system protein GspG [Deltaproteobacteria bacterium]